ncbi:MFS general substrate transporter [Mycena maculata]|uniref:MFS general substrate transporter n=1 Tax=Mycena maculata TaxID=230809 RepID=A0AAD7J5P3_9AGAR|nr:MFS general substrate transporter [Mycena maculata]
MICQPATNWNLSLQKVLEGPDCPRSVVPPPPPYPTFPQQSLAMGCGVLEDTKLSHVPGTALFSEDPNATAYAAYEGIDISTLQHGKGKYQDIILVPQPSRVDLNDPLLWPTWKKHAFFFILTYGTVLAGAVGPLVAADQTAIAAEFNASPNAFAQVLSSYFVLVLGLSTIFLQVGSVKFGKRPIYLITSLLLCVSTVWASYTTSLGSFTGARVMMGIAAAPLEFLVGASINDIYHVHERSVPIAVWNLALINGINVTPIITGQILDKPSLGFRWAFRFFAIACGVLCIAQFFFMPETTFFREGVVPHPKTEASSTSVSEGEKGQVEAHEIEADNQPMKPLRSYASSLKMWNGVYKTSANSFSLLMRPLIMFFTPIVLFGGLIYGLGITFLVLFAVSVSIIFSQPPYNFSSASVGLTYAGPLISAFIATVIAGPLTGLCARVLSKRNKGIFEPEFKLLPIILYLIFGTMGFVGFGMALQRGLPWIGPVMFTSLANFGIVMGSTAAISYVIDSHRHTADAALGSLIFHKNIWSFGLTWNLVDQILEFGPQKVFSVVAGVLVFTCLTAIPMYIFGKRVRSFVHRYIKFSEEDENTIVGH